MDSQAATSEAAERGPCVLLDQCVTLSGRKLAIRVTAKNETNPDTVEAHVQYGTGHAKVTVKDNGQEVTLTRKRKRTSSEGSGSATGRSGVGERGAEVDSPLDGEDTGAPRPSPGFAQTCFSGGKAAGASSSTDEGHQDTALSSSKGGDGTGTSTEASAKPEESMSPGDTNVPLAQRTELHIRSDDPSADLDDKKLGEMLQSMPALRSLKVDWRDDGKKLDIGIVSQYCRNLTEIDLSMFCLDVCSLKQLCAACPDLEVAKLPRNCKDEHVEVLKELKSLRSLDLEKTQVTGNFLAAFQRPIEKLSLADCEKLSISAVAFALNCSDPTLQTLPWNSLRELDLSSINVGYKNLVQILECSPQLERLLVPVDTGYESTDNSAVWLAQLGQCKHLRELDTQKYRHGYSYRTTIPFNELQLFLSGCPKLQRLALEECLFESSTSLCELEKLPELRDLSLLKCGIRHGGRAASIGKELADGLSSCPLLEKLSVTETRYPIEQLVPPKGLPNLTYLDVSLSTGMTHKSLCRLPELFPRLSTLKMVNCKTVGGSDLESFIPKLPELRNFISEYASNSPTVENLKSKMKDLQTTQVLSI